MGGTRWSTSHDSVATATDGAMVLREPAVGRDHGMQREVLAERTVRAQAQEKQKCVLLGGCFEGACGTPAH